MVQKVIKIGRSAGIIIPRKYMEGLEWKVGDNVFFLLDVQGRRLLATKNRDQKFDPLFKKELELLRRTESFIEQYRKDLETLARQ